MQRPCAKPKSNLSKWNFGIGILYKFVTTWNVSKFFLKNSALSISHPPPKKKKFYKLSCLDPLSEILKGHLSSLNKHSNQLMTTTTRKLVIEDDILQKVNSATSRRLRPAKYDVFTREPSFTRTWDYMILTALNGLFF